MTMVMVALCMVAFLLMLSFMLDITSALIRKEQIQTMADLSAAAGGHEVARIVAELAQEKYNEKLTANPFLVLTEYEKKHPEAYIDINQRQRLQNDSTYIGRVKSVVKDYVAKNQPASLTNFDPEANVTVKFPERYIDCNSNPLDKKVKVEVTVHYNYQWIFGELAKLSKAGPGVSLIASQVMGNTTICP